MLSLETRDTWSWTLDVTVGAATETFSNAATDLSAYGAIVALVAWANAAGRAWFGTRTFSWSWARDAASGGAVLTLSATGGTFSITGGASATLKLAASVGVTSVVGSSSAVGTWAPVSKVRVDRHYRELDTQGDAAAGPALRMAALGAAHFNPRVAGAGGAIDTARLHWVLGQASHPRRVWVWQISTSTWRQYALGEVRSDQVDPFRWRHELTCAGPTL